MENCNGGGNWMGICAILLLLPNAVQAQTSIVVSDHRALAAFADQLEQRFGVRVTYEDPAYSYADDLEEAGSRARRQDCLQRQAANRRTAPRELTRREIL